VGSNPAVNNSETAIVCQFENVFIGQYQTHYNIN